MSTPKPDKAIDQLLKAILADQEARLSSKTSAEYDEIIHLYRSYLESYWPDHSGKDDDAVTKAKGIYCGTYGAEDITFGRKLEGHFLIHRTGPRQIWLESMIDTDEEIGPIAVSAKVARACKVGWDVGGVVAISNNGWRLVEVGNTSP